MEDLTSGRFVERKIQNGENPLQTDLFSFMSNQIAVFLRKYKKCVSFS